MSVKVIGFATVLFHILNPCHFHELCADGNPPKDHTNASFRICGEYKHNGCCDEADETIVYDAYKSAVESKTITQPCRNLIEEVLCQKCSPESAHLYEGDANGDRKFPILCQKFCDKLHKECGNISAIIDQPICNNLKEIPGAYCYPDTDATDGHRYIDHSDTQDCVPVCLQVVDKRMKNIVDGAFPPDDSNRLFLVQQDGIIWELDSKRKRLHEPFLDISKKLHKTRGTDERGLLSMVFHPKFKENNLFYLFYNPSRSRYISSRVVKMKVLSAGPGTPMTVDKESEEIILEFNKPESNHNGGQLLFGNDAYLYISTGDGGGGGDRHGQYGNGQSLNTLLGKILRIDVNVPTGYDIPADNPFAQSTGDERKEIFAYGLRNPWRVSIDREIGTIFAGDVGQAGVEEVDIIKKGANYGWRAYEGTTCFDQEWCEMLKQNDVKVTNPIYSYKHTPGVKAVIGGYVYRGKEMSNLVGSYVFGDQGDSQLWALTKSKEAWKKIDLCVGKLPCPEGSLSENPRSQLFAFTEDQEGEIYVLTAKTTRLRHADGIVYKMVPPTSP